METFIIFRCTCGRYFINCEWLYFDEMKPKDFKRIEEGYNKGTINDKQYICSHCRGSK